MVGTRNSISTPDPEAELDADPDISPEHRRRMKSIIKKLQIDALPALKGEAIRRDDSAPTYHYRGSTFVVTETTPKIWLDQEPSRYKKRRSSVDTGTEGEGKKRRRDAVLTRPPQRKVEATATPNRKRARTSDKAEEEEVEDPPLKRPRRHSERYTHDYSRPRDISDFTPGKRKLRHRNLPAPADRMWNSRMNDYTRVGGHETLSCIEHARRRAAMEGLDVHPLHPDKLLSTDRRLRPPARPPTLEETVMSNVMRVAKINTQIDKTERELSLSKNVSRQIEIQRAIAKSAPTTITQTAFAALMASTVQEPTPDTRTPPANNDEIDEVNDEQQNDAHISDSEASPERSSRHDSGASMTQEDIYHPAQPTVDLPTKNKAGQDLRWSLPDRLNDADSAESAIHTARLPNESKAARRRRVRREYALVKQWKAAQDDQTPPPEGDDTPAKGDQDEIVTDYIETQERTPTTPDGENPVPDSAERRSSRVPKQKNQVCRDWVLGACHRGDRCTYVHES